MPSSRTELSLDVHFLELILAGFASDGTVWEVRPFGGTVLVGQKIPRADRHTEISKNYTRSVYELRPGAFRHKGRAEPMFPRCEAGR